MLLLALLVPAVARPQADAERLRSAKALFFDKDYDEARSAWQAIRDAGGRDAQAALYWIARCSESLGESERALGEYGEYLAEPACGPHARRGGAHEPRRARGEAGARGPARAGRDRARGAVRPEPARCATSRRCAWRRSAPRWAGRPCRC